jgi:hypothetical protein
VITLITNYNQRHVQERGLVRRAKGQICIMVYDLLRLGADATCSCIKQTVACRKSPPLLHLQELLLFPSRCTKINHFILISWAVNFSRMQFI